MARRFCLEHGGRIYADQRVVLALYFRAPHAEIAEGLGEAFDAFVGRADVAWIGGKRINAGHQALYASYDDKLRKRVRNRLTAARGADHPDEHFDLRDVAVEQELARHRLRYDTAAPHQQWEHVATGILELWLPIEGFDPDWLISFVRPLPFVSGVAGIGLVEHGVPDPVGFARATREWAFAHPALQLPNHGGPAQRLGTRVWAVSWLTFLSAPVLQRCGVSAPGELDLPASASVVDVAPGRWAVRIGTAPEVDIDAPLRQVARALWPAWFVQWCAFGGGLHDDDSIRWQLRWFLPP